MTTVSIFITPERDGAQKGKKKMNKIYQFAFHGNVKPEPTDCEMFTLFRKIAGGKALTRDEKDRVARATVVSPTYKFLGYAAPFHEVLPRFVAKIQHYGWLEFYTPDKTSLRRAITGVMEIL